MRACHGEQTEVCEPGGPHRPRVTPSPQPHQPLARVVRYPIYILHQTVIIGLAYFVVPEPWSPWLKYWLVLGATLAICVLLYEGVLRRSALLRLLFGINARETPGFGQ
jgi:hypothetical protein